MEKIKFETVESTLWYILFLTERKTFLSEASVKEKEMGVCFILTIQLTPPTKFSSILKLGEKKWKQ